MSLTSPFWLAVLLLACSTDPSASLSLCAAEGTTRAAVYGGHAESQALSEAQALAVVAVLVGERQAICSGVLVERDVVLTAGHCVAAAGTEGLSVVIGDSIEAPLVTLPVLTTETHPSLDVVALGVALPACAAAEPLPLLQSELSADWVGQSVELSGFGVTDARQLGSRFFASEEIADIETDWIVVASPTSSSGACRGDSGGPVLATVNGQVVVLGTLDDGATSCLGRDNYVRADRIAPWLSQ
jgi:hypothetical protein